MTGTMSAIMKCGCIKFIPICMASALLSGVFTDTGYTEEKEKNSEPIQQDAVVVADQDTAQDGPVTYSVRITKGPDRIKLKGNISSEEDYKTLIGMVKANFPSMSLSDRVTIEPNAPVPDVKIGGLSFALKVLGYVENGHAIFDDNGLLLEGSVDTAVVLDQVQQFVEKEKPEGVSVKALRVSAPELSWRVRLGESDTINISGIIPDAKKKEEVLGELQALFPAHTIVDNSVIAESLPGHWDESIAKSIEMLAYLEHGLIDVTESAINVRGHAEDRTKLDLLLEVTKNVPTSVAVNSEVTAPERTSTFKVIGGASTLSAKVPSLSTNIE